MINLARGSWSLAQPFLETWSWTERFAYRGDTSMSPRTAAQSAVALVRLEGRHSMLKLDEAVEIAAIP